MVSLIGWIVTTSSSEDFVSTTLDEPSFVETTCANSGICEDDVAPEVLVLLVLVERCFLHLPEMASGGKGGLSYILYKIWGKGCSSSMIID